MRFEKSQEIWGTKCVNSRYIYIYIWPWPMYDLIHIICIILFVLWPEHGRNLTKTHQAYDPGCVVCARMQSEILSSFGVVNLWYHTIYSLLQLVLCCSSMHFCNILFGNCWLYKDPMLVAMFLPSTRRLGLVLEGGIRSIFRRTETSQTS